MDILKINKVTISKEEAVQNILDIYNRTSFEDKAVDSEWYFVENHMFNTWHGHTGMYKHYNQQVCFAVIAILSPGCSWEKNIVNAKDMLVAHSKGESIDSFKVSTYGRNKEKAWKLLDMAKEGKLFGIERMFQYVKGKTGFKTGNFFLNLYMPSLAKPVTIDRHALKVILNEPAGGALTVTEKNYKLAMEIYHEAFNRIDDMWLKNTACLQAVVWCQYKREVNR